MNTLRIIGLVVAAILSASSVVRADQHVPLLPIAKLTGDGMYAQEWLYGSSLDLRKDLAATVAEGKRLVIFWEQKKCAYCAPMYEINLRIPRVVDKITNNFNVIKLDIEGKRTVIDLDGTSLTEVELARKSSIVFTPTIQFLPESLEMASGKSIQETEVFRSEGYFKPFHFYFLFHYVQSKGYVSQPHFQRWLGGIGRGMAEKGIEYDLWADALPLYLPKKY